MQIIIPMTGYGSRFVRAGYQDLKPFIPVEGKPIIQWIIEKIYPEEKNFLFICRTEHLKKFSTMEKTLLNLAPTAKIFAIDDWQKNGPVFDVMRAKNLIDDDEPAVINYCDFYMTWDWQKFQKKLLEKFSQGWSGCVPCYTGFHPHLLPKKNLYASCLTDENDNLIEIREKFSFEDDKTKAKHSPGNYFFKSGAVLKKYCQQLIDSNERLNGEFYASLVFNFLVRDGLKVWVPTDDVKFFCQWGTPEDMQESIYWLNMMKKVTQ